MTSVALIVGYTAATAAVYLKLVHPFFIAMHRGRAAAGCFFHWIVVRFTVLLLATFSLATLGPVFCYGSISSRQGYWLPPALGFATAIVFNELFEHRRRAIRRLARSLPIDN